MRPSTRLKPGARIGIITMGVKLLGETRGYTRYWSLATMLAEAGFEVDLITSRFQHWDKAQRKVEALDTGSYPFKVVFIDEPGYQKNLSIGRVLSHRQAAKNLTHYLKQAEPYQLLFSEIPPNDVALSAAKFAEEEGIPFILDVNDLWPEAMRMALDVALLSDILFYPFARDAREVFRRVSGVVGTSDEYAARPFTHCAADTPRITVYVGNELEEFDRGAERYSAEVSLMKEPGDFWVTYAGTLGASYDLSTLIEAAALLKQRGLTNIKLLILGDGPDRNKLQELAARLEAPVLFMGYTAYEKMAAYLKASDVLVNSLVKKAPQSIVNKIADYLAAGKPMINTGTTPELRAKIARQDLGVSIEAEDATVAAAAIEELFSNGEARARMGSNARQVSETEFDRKTSYVPLIDFIATSARS
jgi:glycosyltransferase involved in cell wall biosynthesis